MRTVVSVMSGDTDKCQWSGEQNWRQVKTVFSSPHRILRLDKTVSTFSVTDSLDLSPILVTDVTVQDSIVCVGGVN